MNNVITRVDSYKFSHYKQLPPDTTKMFSYIESRGGLYDSSLFFGLQMWLHELTKPIIREDIDEAEIDVKSHGLPFNREGWEHILTKCRGYLPIKIMAVPEGTVVPVRNVLVTVENTDDVCPWVTSFIETQLLRAVWYPTTVATLSLACKVKILQFRMLTCDDPLAGLDFSLHDFGARGVSSAQSAEIGGAAHLVNFKGSDTFESLRVIHRVYHKYMASLSIPAAEHSTITSWRDGDDTHELEAYDNMLNQFAKPGQMVAIVSDSYNLWNAINNIWGDDLKQKIIDSGATVIIRPDTGDAQTVPVKAVQALSEKFGYTTNRKGYKVLPHYIRVIQGDGVTPTTIPIILDNLMKSGFSVENLALGMGGGLLQHVNRDTMKFAMKASARCSSDGKWHDIYKDPIDDPSKRSKAGRLALISDSSGKYQTVFLAENTDKNILQPVFENGKILKEYTFEEIRERAHVSALSLAGFTE